MNTENKPQNFGAKKRSLKNLWLNPEYQKRYIFWISITGFALILMNSVTFYIYTSENYTILVDNSPMTPEAKAFMYKELREIIIYLLLGNFGFLFICGILGLVFSHRTVGPMYHFKRIFNEIEKGNFSARVRLRPKDDFKDVADACNRMLDTIEQASKKT